MTARDRWAIGLDWAEYAVRRLGCRLFGHRWSAEYQDIGGASYLECYRCNRCHTETVRP